MPKDPTRARPAPTLALMPALIAILLVGSLGCASMWDRVRERERLFALESARTYAKRGSCVEALESLDRAQARMDLGAYGREAISTRIRCYERLGRTQAARAHRRLLEDFYGASHPAHPAADGSSVFRATLSEGERFEAPPSMLKIESPSYSEYARRSKIIGRVVVAFELAKDNSTKNIRVLEMPHPLLASWAIEAIEHSRPPKKYKDAVMLSQGPFVTTFAFEWRWAKADDGDPDDGIER